MEKTILCESAGWVLFSDGPRLVFADRGTSYRRVLLFVLGLIAVITGGNGVVWLVLGGRSGEISTLGVVLTAVAAVAVWGALRVRAAEKREGEVIPGRDTWKAVLDLEKQTLESPQGETLSSLSEVRFMPVMQLASSSKALAARWPGGSRVVYRGNPFAGSYQQAVDALRRHGVEGA